MASNAPTSRPSGGSGATRRQRRRIAAAEQAAEARRTEKRRRLARWGGTGLVAALAVAIGVAMWTTRSAENSSGSPVVGGDLHTLAAIGDVLYVGGHEAVAVSRDDGKSWRAVPSLAGADAMGWAEVSGEVLVGGHPGLYRSTDGGLRFAPVSNTAGVTDVHALGGAGSTVYLASPQAGLLVSTDRGRHWQVRNARVGASFMGTILVAPQDRSRLIAPDMAGALLQSRDGGRTWAPLGGPMGAMSATWNPTDRSEIVAVGMKSSERSSDGGATWHNLEVPQGTTAVTYSDDGRTLYAAALDDEQADIYRSTDNGATWIATA